MSVRTSFRPEGNEWVDLGRPTGGEKVGRGRDENQASGREQKRGRVVSGYAINESRQCPCKQERAEEAERGASAGQP